MTSISELPFPWVCGSCNTMTVERVEISYSFDVHCETGGTRFVEIPRFVVPRCTRCGAMVLDDRALDQIEHAAYGRIACPS